MGTVPVLRTWTAGELVTASYMNANIRDAGNFYQATPTCQLRQAVSQVFVTSGNVNCLFDTEVIDSDNGHSTSTNTERYTGKTPGYYQVTGGIGWSSNATGIRCTWLTNQAGFIQGSQNKFSATNGASSCVPSRVKFVAMNGSTDYVTVAGFQNSGASLNTSLITEEISDMTVHWLRT